MRFEGRKIRSGFPSLFCFHFFGWLRRRKRAAKKIIATAGRLAGGSFQRLIENPPPHGKLRKRKIPRRQAAAGRLAGDFREIPRAPSTSATLGFPVWKDACFCSPPARHDRGYFQTEEPAQGKRPQLRSRLEEIKQGSVFSSCAGEASPDMFFLITYS